MNKNLYLALALCATFSSSLVFSSDNQCYVSCVPSRQGQTDTRLVPDHVDAAIQKSVVGDVEGLSPVKPDKVEMPEEPGKVVAPSMVSRLTTLQDNPLRLSTYAPVQKYAGRFTPVVDVAAAAAVFAGLGYAAFANKDRFAKPSSSVTRFGMFPNKK